MEKAVRNNDFVLIICTPEYKRKSDGRLGGVGYEGDIITAEVMTSQNHRKFIPILKVSEWTDSAPSWLLGKYYIDLRGAPYSDANYRTLSETLLGIPVSPPPIGRADTTIPPVSTDVSAPDFTYRIELIEGLSYSGDQDREYKKLAQVALDHKYPDVAIQAIQRISYSGERDQMYKRVFENCLQNRNLTLAGKLIDRLSYSGDRDAARKQLLKAING